MLWALLVCQGLQIGAAMLVFGAEGFVAALPPPGLARRLDPALRRIEAVGVPVLLLTAVAWLPIQSALFAEAWSAGLDPGVLGAVLSGTTFGTLWAVHFGVIGALAAALLVRMPRGVTTYLSGIGLASLGLFGHANLHASTLGLAHRANEMVHLLASGAWLGSLVPFLIVMKDLGGGEEGREAVTTLRRFSRVGHAVVACVLATGVANSVLVLGPRPFAAPTPYLAVLCAKVALVALMTGLAISNRYRVVPLLARRPEARSWLGMLTICNLGLGAAVLLLASGLGLLDPVPGP